MNSWPQVTEDWIVVRHLQGCLLIQTKLLIKPEHSSRAWDYTLIGGVTTRNNPKIVKSRVVLWYCVLLCGIVWYCDHAS